MDYSQCVNEDGMVSDNAGLMLLKLLERCGARQVFLQGLMASAPSRRPATTVGKPSCPSTPRSFSSASAAWGEQLRRLPGIGSKTALRLAYHIIDMPEEEVRRLAETLLEAKRRSVCVIFVIILLMPRPVRFAAMQDATTV